MQLTQRQEVFFFGNVKSVAGVFEVRIETCTRVRAGKRVT